MLNSDELRASYDACLPLLSNYWTDLAQSEPLFRAYSAIAANEGGLDSITAQRSIIERALEDSGWRESGCPCERKARYKTVVQEMAQARRQIRGERARRDERVDAPGHRRARTRRDQSWASSNRHARAPPKRRRGLAVRARATHLRRRDDRCGLRNAAPHFYEAWSTRASERNGLAAAAPGSFVAH